jgi:uncharacterized protein YijF (DUF1287 family)
MTTRRAILAAALLTPAGAFAAPTGEGLAAAARRQVGVTTDYDPAYRKLAYPGGDVPRSTGVCADVVIRAARDAWGRDLQRLVHEDMGRAFGAYPSKARWGLSRPDANIDHRRVLNLEAYWSRAGARLWRASRPTLGHAFPLAVQPGDILTWRVGGSLPHVGVVSAGGIAPRVVHNIGGGADEALLASFVIHQAVGHYRWRPV